MAQDGAPSDGPRASAKPAELLPGGKPPAVATGKVPVADTAADRWGDLPVNARDVFRAQGGSDLPVRYREWIDAYFKRLNSTR
jgi:hypothetical protein